MDYQPTSGHQGYSRPRGASTWLLHSSRADDVGAPRRCSVVVKPPVSIGTCVLRWNGLLEVLRDSEGVVGQPTVPQRFKLMTPIKALRRHRVASSSTPRASFIATDHQPFAALLSRCDLVQCQSKNGVSHRLPPSHPWKYRHIEHPEIELAAVHGRLRPSTAHRRCKSSSKRPTQEKQAATPALWSFKAARRNSFFHGA